MNNSIAAVATESLQSFQKCEAFREKLIAEIEIDRCELKKISQVTKYTSEIKKKKKRLEEQIKDKLCNLDEVEAMLKLKPGNWVRNGTTRPGKVIELKIAGRIPEVHVLWWNNTVAVPERPRLLKPIELEDLEYIWDAQQFPKLIRRIDRFECEDLQVLQKEYESALDSKKITYCRKRFNYLTQEKFPSGIRVQLGSLFGTTLKYPDPNTKSLIQVPLTLDADESGKHFVKRAVSPVELINLGYQDHLQPKKKQLDKILDFCNQKPEVKNLPIDKIKRDGGTQQRVSLNHETVIEYAEAMKSGDRFPPVKLKYDGENYWLTDGFHTTEAAWSIGRTEIEAEITQGTLRDAILDSVAVNANHGLRRTNADKRRAVMTLLEDEEWKQWSDREIARKCKVDHKTVGKIRKDLTGEIPSDNPKNDNQIMTGEIPSYNPKTYKDRYGNISQMNTENVGNKKKVDNSEDVEQMNGCFEYAPEDLTVNVHSHNPKTYKDNYEKVSNMKTETDLISNFKVGQIVKISPDSDRSDKRLVGLKNSLGIITAINPNSIDLKLFGQSITAVSPNDIKPLDELFEPTICLSMSQTDLGLLLLNLESIEEIIKIAIEKIKQKKAAEDDDWGCPPF